jgi:hypothetical protein
MTISKRLRIVALALVLSISALELGALLDFPGVHGLATDAQAIIGRPLTPVSVAGVARRTARRCVVGVYRC